MTKSEAIIKICGEISALLTALSGATYALGDVATVIPPKLKAYVFGVSAVATVALKAWGPISSIIQTFYAPQPPPPAGAPKP